MTGYPVEPVVVTFHGELTIAEAPALRDTLLDAIRAGGQLLVLDMSEVAFVDQSALGVVIGARARLRRAGGDLRLACLQPKVARVIDLVGGHLPVYPTVSAAADDPMDS